MTLRNRNRINISLLTLSLIVLFSYLSITVFRIVDHSFELPVFSNEISDNFLIGFHPISVFIAIYIEILFACGLSYFILHNFEKTQSADIIFFYLLIFACICDSSRFYIPMFNLTRTYTKAMFTIGSVILFGRLLAPLSFFAIATMTDESQFQDIERNCFIILILSLFFAIAIPINITKIYEDYSIAYSFRKTINSFTVVLMILNVGVIYFKNKDHAHSQKTTIGFALLSFGIIILFTCTILFHLILAVVTICSGAYIYLTDLHSQYLWNN